MHCGVAEREEAALELLVAHEQLAKAVLNQLGQTSTTQRRAFFFGSRRLTSASLRRSTTCGM